LVNKFGVESKIEFSVQNTLFLFKKGLIFEEIALKRQIKLGTV
jgi:hypothetical protein